MTNKNKLKTRDSVSSSCQSLILLRRNINYLVFLVGYVMPISSNNLKSPSKKLTFNLCGKSAAIHTDDVDQEDSQFFTIAPALPILPGALTPSKLTKRSYSTGFTSSQSSTSTIGYDDAEVGSCDVALQQVGDGKTTVVATRTTAEREKNPDRICLDRRGLTTFPNITGEPKLRLMSLQHNLLSRIEGQDFTQLTKLVFLDLYDNQIERIVDLVPLENLRVLLIGKNRIKKIEGLKSLIKLEVLDLHGNQIVQISGLENLASLKVLNLAGNNVRLIGCNDLHGLTALKELNLKRNKIKKLLGFNETPQLQKLYLSNNDIHKIEDMGSLAKALEIREITIDGNPVSLNADCISFLVSYLPNLQILSTMQVSEQVRRAAMAWRTTKEQSNSAFLDLSTQVCVNVRREEVIINAKKNWQLLRAQTKSLANNSNNKLNNNIKNEKIRDFNLQNSSKFDTAKLKGGFDEKLINTASLSSISVDREVKKIQFKKRSSSTDALLQLDHTTKINLALDFKLPPILVPIINNITSCKINSTSASNSGNPKNNLAVDSMDLTTDSEFDSSESHESLKSGLRNHLINTNSRSQSTDIDKKNNIYTLNNFCNFTEHQLNAMKNHQIIKPNSGNKVKNNNDNNNNINNNKGDIDDGGVETNLKKCVNISNTNSNNSNNNSNNRRNIGFSGINLCNLKSGSLDSSSSSSNSTKITTLDSSSGKSSVDNYNDSGDEKSRVKSAAHMKKIVHYRSNRAATARAKHRAVVQQHPSSVAFTAPKEKEQGGDYLIEIIGYCLNVYGQGALRFIDRPWDVVKANDVNTVKFNYVQFNGIATILNKIKTRFPNAQHFIFKETNISHLGQINALAEIQGFKSIQIDAEGNPIISKDWRVYAIFRLHHWGLKTINGKEITDDDVEAANKEYSGLTDIVMWSLPDTLLQPLLHRLDLEKVQKQNGERITAKQFLFTSDPALRNVVAKEALQWRRGNVTQDDLISRHKGKVHLSNFINQTVDAIQKLQLLEDEWPNILHEIVYTTLVDFSNMNLYMKEQSKVLESK